MPKPTHGPDQALAQGRQLAESIDPAIPSSLEEMFDLAPGLAASTLRFAFGELMSRPGLSLKERELIIVAVLTASGEVDALRLHIGFALRVGVQQEQLVEAIVQTIPYGGYPRCIAALRVASEVLTAR